MFCRIVHKWRLQTPNMSVQPWKSLPDPGPCKQKLNSGPEKSLAYIACIAHASSSLPVSRIVLQVVLAVLFNHGLLATQRSFQSQPRNYAGRPCLEGCLWGNSTSQLVSWFLFESHHEERKDSASFLNLYHVSTQPVQRISCTIMQSKILWTAAKCTSFTCGKISEFQRFSDLATDLFGATRSLAGTNSGRSRKRAQQHRFDFAELEEQS